MVVFSPEPSIAVISVDYSNPSERMSPSLGKGPYPKTPKALTVPFV